MRLLRAAERGASESAAGVISLQERVAEVREDLDEQHAVIQREVPSAGARSRGNLDNWRRRMWSPAIEAAGIARPARIYDLRSTFASDALAAGVPVFTLAKMMGTSVRMIERHYGALLDGAGFGIAGQLDALDAERDQAADRAGQDT